MSPKVAIVTGSNKGIGLAIVTALCKQFDGDVYLTSRDEGRGLEAVESLKKQGLFPKYHQLDIDSAESVEGFKAWVSSLGGIDILVNNAAVAFLPDSPEPYHVQAEVTNRTNFFHTMRFCDTVFPLLKPHGRVVNISSSLGFLKQIPSDELQKKFASPKLTKAELSRMIENYIELTKQGKQAEHGWPTQDAMFSVYLVSKVAISALTRIQQRELDASRPGDDIIVNSVHPGYVDTDLNGHTGYLTTEQGAVAATWLALLPQGVEGPKGGFVWHDKTVIDWVNGPLPAQW